MGQYLRFSAKPLHFNVVHEYTDVTELLRPIIGAATNDALTIT